MSELHQYFRIIRTDMEGLICENQNMWLRFFLFLSAFLFIGESYTFFLENFQNSYTQIGYYLPTGEAEEKMNEEIRKQAEASFGGYLQMFFLAWMMGILFAAINLIACFTSSLNVAATLYAGMVVLVVIGYLLCSVLLDIDFTFLFQMNTLLLLGGIGLAVALIVIVTYFISLQFFLRQRAKI